MSYYRYIDCYDCSVVNKWVQPPNGALNIGGVGLTRWTRCEGIRRSRDGNMDRSVWERVCFLTFKLTPIFFFLYSLALSVFLFLSLSLSLSLSLIALFHAIQWRGKHMLPPLSTRTFVIQGSTRLQ